MGLFSRSRTADMTPLDGVDVVLTDLDGVVYQGPDAIPFAVESLSRAHDAGLTVGYITNNASRTDAQVAEQLSGFGLTVAPQDVVTSPQAAMGILTGLVAPGSRILVVGGVGLTSEVEKAGFTVVTEADQEPAAVVQGFAPDVGWKQLAQASFAVSTGIPWVATNTDWTIPVKGGIAPGNGTLVSAVHTATGRLPEVAGKPETPIFEAAVERFTATSPLFIGDRLDTDILGAKKAGIRAVHVLTGIDKAKQLLAAPADSRPDFILGDLRELFEPYPATQVASDGAKATVGTSVVERQGQRIVVVKEGASSLDLVRAGCAVIWGSGISIHVLDVDARLYS